MIRVVCPTCSETRDFSANLAGWEVRCFWCQNPISVPDRAGTRAEPRRAMRAGSRRPPMARRVVEVATPDAVLIA